MRNRWILGTSLLIAGALGVMAHEARAATHKDEKLGFQITPPKNWDTMPLMVDDSSWVVAKFQTSRDYEASDPKTNNWEWLRPYIEVVVIPLSAREDHGATLEETDRGIRIRENAPWKDLKGYLEEHCKSIGGFHFVSEEEGELNDMKLIRYEIKVDRMVTGERTVHGWAFYGRDAIYGLVTQYFEKDAKRLEPEVLRSFSSFRTFARTGSLPNTARTGKDIVVKENEKKARGDMSEEELEAERKAAFERTLSRAKETLPDGWYIMEGRNYVAVSHADRKYTKELIQHAEALRNWLEEELGFVGTGYLGKVLIRICADTEEHSAYQQSRGWFSDAPEIITFQDKSGWSDWSMESLNRNVFSNWLKDRNDRLLWGAPAWVNNGLRDFIEGARVKRGRVEFKEDTWDSVEMKNLRRSDGLFTARDFFTLTSEEMWSDWNNQRQIQFFIRFLLTGPAQRSRKYKNLFSDYIKNLIFRLDSVDFSKDIEALNKEPENEQEEMELNRQRQQYWKQREREELDSLREKTFEGWDDRDWAAFDALYKQFLK